MQGYIKLHRKIIDSDIYKMPMMYLRVFERLILEANHMEKEIPYKAKGSSEIGHKLIRRGERLTSIRQICHWVGWYENGIFRDPNPKTISKILDYLEQNQMIIIYGERGNRSETHYKVCNYNTYQGSFDEEKGAQVTLRKHSTDINENVKNDKNNYTVQIFDHNSEAFRCAKYLDQEICGRIVQKKLANESQLQSWAEEFEAIYKEDGYDWETISWVLAFSQEDEFWKNQILTGKVFRKHFLQLLAKKGA